MAQLSAVSVPVTRQNNAPEQSVLVSDSEEEVESDQESMDGKYKHQNKESNGAASLEEATNTQPTDNIKYLPGTPLPGPQNGFGRVSAEISAGTINQLALNRTASSSSKSGRKTAFTESPPQSPGKRKRQQVSDTPVSPSKQTLPERGRNTMRHGHERQSTGQLRRPSDALANKSTTKQTVIPARNDVYAVESGSPVGDKQTQKPKPLQQAHTEARSGKTAARSSSPAVRSGAEKPIATNSTIDHVSKSNTGSANHTRATPTPAKPKGRLRKQSQPTQLSASESRITRSGNHYLRSTGHSIVDKPEEQGRKTVSTKAGRPTMVKPVREDKLQTAKRSADDDSDSVNGNPSSSEHEQETSGDAGPQLGSNACETQLEEHGDNNGPKDDNVGAQGEERDAEVEDDVSANHHQVRSTTKFLFRGPNWDKVIEGADTVGDSNTKGVITKGKPKLETLTIKAFVKQVRIAAKIYKASGERGQLAPVVQELERQVEAIKEDEAGTKKRKMIQDIYAHAIPELVFLLGKALDAREAECSAPDHVKGLEELIWLQSIVISLCEKARMWKEEPETDRPIKKSTTQKILPSLRSIRKDFNIELQRRKREILSKQDEAAGKFHRKRREEELRQQEIDAEEERLANWDQIKEQLDHNEQTVFGRRLSRPPSAAPPSTTGEWTVEQELVLNKGLEDFGDLPASDRYLQLLTLPELQEKLPEHIRQRALYSRPNLENYYEKKQGWVPDWVTSIE